jgi:hypothetical protein
MTRRRRIERRGIPVGARRRAAPLRSKRTSADSDPRRLQRTKTARATARSARFCFPPKRVSRPPESQLSSAWCRRRTTPIGGCLTSRPAGTGLNTVPRTPQRLAKLGRWPALLASMIFDPLRAVLAPFVLRCHRSRIDSISQIGPRTKTVPLPGLFQCAREDSNLHGELSPQGPQPCASTNSATGAEGASIDLGRSAPAGNRGEIPARGCE